MSDDSPATPSSLAFLDAPGEMGGLIRDLDWTSTALGPIAFWPQSLMTAVGMIVRSHVPIVMLWGEDGVMIYNDGYSRFAGGRHPDQLGMKVREGWPEVSDFNDNVMKVCLAGGTLAYQDQELTLDRRGVPEQVWMDLDYSPIPDESGRPAGVMAIVIETTEQVRAQREARAAEVSLRKSEARQIFRVDLNDALRGASDPKVLAASAAELLGHHLGTGCVGYAEVDPGGELIVIEQDWTAAGVASVVGTHRLADFGPAMVAELRAGRTVVVHDTTTDPRTAGSLYEAAYAAVGVRAFVDAPLVKDGRLAGILFVLSPVARSWSEGETALIVEAAERTWNWLQRLRVEEALRRSEARFRSVAEAVPGFVWTANEQGLLDYTSPNWHSYSGSDPEASNGQGWALFVHPDDQAEAFARWSHCVATRTPYETEFRLRSAAGAYRWWLARARPVADDATGGTRWIGTCTDLEEIVAAREILSRSREELEALVRAKTAELMAVEEQLRQSQKMEAVGQLTGGIAHDFNNLLTGIVGSLDLMQTRMAQGRMENIERYAKAAMSSANRAAALTYRLLAFARRHPVDPKPTNANQLVTSLEELLLRTIGESIGLEIVAAGGLWPTVCDPHQLESAILNLAINARDAMPAGGKLTLETCNTHLDRRYATAHPGVEPGQYICICVTDTGTGMPPDVIARAFDPFFTTKPLGQGTGLGLSMVYGFARQSEGFAKIYSELDRGTTVKIYLPRYRGEVGPEAEPPELAVQPRAAHGETVLVVEDEAIVRDLIVEVLHDLGYRALDAADGPAGLKILQSPERIDLLVTDVGLPGLNGRQLADQARVGRPDLKVLFITGYAENATFGNGHLDPGMQMITKPFPVQALASRIREMVGS